MLKLDIYRIFLFYTGTTLKGCLMPSPCKWKMIILKCCWKAKDVCKFDQIKNFLYPLWEGNIDWIVKIESAAVTYTGMQWIFLWSVIVLLWCRGIVLPRGWSWNFWSRLISYIGCVCLCRAFCVQNAFINHLHGTPERLSLSFGHD